EEMERSISCRTGVEPKDLLMRSSRTEVMGADCSVVGGGTAWSCRALWCYVVPVKAGKEKSWETVSGGWEARWRWLAGWRWRRNRSRRWSSPGSRVIRRGWKGGE